MWVVPTTNSSSISSWMMDSPALKIGVFRMTSVFFLDGNPLHSDVSSTNTQLAIHNLRCSHGWRKELLLHHLRLLLLVPCRLLSFAGASLLFELLVAAVAIAMPRDPRHSPRSLVRFRTHLFHVANWMYDFILF